MENDQSIGSTDSDLSERGDIIAILVTVQSTPENWDLWE